MTRPVAKRSSSASHPPGLFRKVRYLTGGIRFCDEGATVKYRKPALTLDDQASLLASRGMGGGSDEIRRRLTQVNYYRLAAYWHPFRNDGEDTFRSGTTIRNVWRRYLFDRRLRLLTMDALERFEVTVRSRLVRSPQESHLRQSHDSGVCTGTNSAWLRVGQQAHRIARTASRNSARTDGLSRQLARVLDLEENASVARPIRFG